MLQAFIMKRIAGAIIKKVMAKRAIKKMQQYVEKPNELDHKVLELENRILKLEKDSHPPIFTKNSKKDIDRRLKDIEKRLELFRK